jgi:hypothetical protein
LVNPTCAGRQASDISRRRGVSRTLHVNPRTRGTGGEVRGATHHAPLQRNAIVPPQRPRSYRATHISQTGRKQGTVGFYLYKWQIVASGKESSLAQLQVIQNAAIRAALGLRLADRISTTELLRRAGQKSMSELYT